MTRERGDDPPNPSFSDEEGRTEGASTPDRKRVECDTEWQPNAGPPP